MSRDSDDDMKVCDLKGLQPAPFTIAIYPQEQGPTYLLIESRHEKVSVPSAHPLLTFSFLVSLYAATLLSLSTKMYCKCFTSPIC